MNKLFFPLLGVFVLIGCGSESDGAITIPEDSGVTDTSPAETANRPATPTIVGVMPMGGAYHVTWKLNDTELSRVELWRSNDGAAATLVTALPGNANNQHDGDANDGRVKYCWMVKTFRGALESEPSPEKCTK